MHHLAARLAAMNDYVISGLLRRRRELAGDALELMGRVDALANDIDALDRALRLFDPGIDLDTIPALQSRPKPDWALRGEVVRIVFSILKEAPEPLSTQALTAEVMARRGYAGEVTRLHLKRVRKCLDRQKVNGRLRSQNSGGLLCWQMN